VGVRGCGGDGGSSADDHSNFAIDLACFPQTFEHTFTSRPCRPTHPNVCCSLPSVLNDKRLPCCRRHCRRISSRRCLLSDKMCLRAHTKIKMSWPKILTFRSCSPEPSFAMHQQHRLTPSSLHGPLLRISIHSLTQRVCLFVCLFSCWHVCLQTDHNDATWATCSRPADGKRVHGAVSGRPATELTDAVVQHALAQAAAAVSARD
jgi:hypothetical protein